MQFVIEILFERWTLSYSPGRGAAEAVPFRMRVVPPSAYWQLKNGWVNLAKVGILQVVTPEPTISLVSNQIGAYGESREIGALRTCLKPLGYSPWSRP